MMRIVHYYSIQCPIGYANLQRKRERERVFLLEFFFLIETVIIKKRLSMIKVLFVILLYQTTGFKLLDFDITHYLTDVELTLYSTSTTTTKKKEIKMIII